METIQQGEILCLEKLPFPVLVLSKAFFNRSGLAIACPIRQEVLEDALHISVITEKMQGTAMLEQMRSIDLRARYYSRIGMLDFEQIQNIADAVQSIFDYYPFSQL